MHSYFKKLFCVLSFSFSLSVSLSAQTPFLVGPSGPTGATGAIQVNQDDATGNVGIGINPTTTDCALAVSNANYGTPPTIIMGVGNMVNGLTPGPGTSAASFACIRVDNSTTPAATAHTPLAIDFIVDALGLVGIGGIASYDGDGFAHLFLMDPNPSGTIPLMRVVTNANNSSASPKDAFFINYTGNIGIGTINPLATLDVQGVVRIGNVPVSSTSAATLATDYSLYVEKGVIAEKFKCALKGDASNWSDYVFDKTYKLKSLAEVEAYIKANKHLPDVPSAEEVKCDGIDMAQMDATLLKKIEELTLYMLELKKDNEALKAQLINLTKMK
jgi:hypothetical protein